MDRPLGSALRTPLCDLLGVGFPLSQAPMAGGWTTPELVAAVCEASGLGVLAGARVSPERLAEDIREVRTRTDRPFGVNFLLAPPEAGSGEVAAVQRFLDRFRERFGLPPEVTMSPRPTRTWENRSGWSSRSGFRCSPRPWETPEASSGRHTSEAWP